METLILVYTCLHLRRLKAVSENNVVCVNLSPSENSLNNLYITTLMVTYRFS